MSFYSMSFRHNVDEVTVVKLALLLVYVVLLPLKNLLPLLSEDLLYPFATTRPVSTVVVIIILIPRISITPTRAINHSATEISQSLLLLSWSLIRTISFTF